MISVADNLPTRFDRGPQMVDGELLTLIVTKLAYVLKLYGAGPNVAVRKTPAGPGIFVATPGIAANAGIIPVVVTQSGGSNGTAGSSNMACAYKYNCKSLDGSKNYTPGGSLTVFFNRTFAGPATTAQFGWGIPLNIPSSQGGSWFMGGTSSPTPFTLMWVDEQAGGTTSC
jgi:hypothetical protein